MTVLWCATLTQVFRPSHILPTRTLAEQADIEIREAQEREQVRK
jgi:hypothetical protein